MCIVTRHVMVLSIQSKGAMSCLFLDLISIALFVPVLITSHSCNMLNYAYTIYKLKKKKNNYCLISLLCPLDKNEKYLGIRKENNGKLLEESYYR